MNAKAKKTMYLAIAIIVVIAIYFLFFAKPSYEDTFTPKPLKGNAEATVKVVEFSDLQCPACAAAHPVVQKIMEEYGDRVSLEYKHFPLSFHLFAFDAAMASECANDQGKFWEYIDMAFANQNTLQKKNLKKFAADLNLDTALFNACLDAKAKEKYVAADINEGMGKNVEGTPTFFINGEKLGLWQYASFKEELDKALE